MSINSICRVSAMVASLAGLGSCGTAASCLGMSSCMPTYAAPVGSSVAMLDFKLDRSTPPVFYEMQIHLGTDPELQSGQYVGIIRQGTPLQALSTTSDTGTRIYLRLIATIPHARCLNVASFIPEPGRSYEISQVPRDGSCAITVRDNATSDWPASYQVHDANKAVPFILP